MIQDILSRTQEWFRKAVPMPTSKNFSTQLGCHFEEVAEMLGELSATGPEALALMVKAQAALEELSAHLKSEENAVILQLEDREGYLDALCDQIVTLTGCAHMSDMDISGGLHEVNNSNFSKFDENGEPIFNENMKVMKGPGYAKPDLAPFI